MELFRETESAAAVEKVKHKGEQLWPILRIYYFFQLRETINQTGNSISVNNLVKKIGRLKYFLYGVANIFKPSDYIFMSTSDENKSIDGKTKNKLFFRYFELLKNDRILFFERPAPGHVAIGQNANPNPASTTIIDTLAAGLSFFMRAPKIENEGILKEIQSQLKINVNDILLTKLFYSYRIVLRILLKIKKPKQIIVSDYYNLITMALICESKKLGITTIEIQHGVVNYEHCAYNFYNKQIISNCCPDYLFCFGQSVKDELSDSSYIPVDKILVTGHAYLDFVKKRELPVANNNSVFKIKCAVTLQWIDEIEVINFISTAAQLNPAVEYILLPRSPDRYRYKLFNLPENVRVEYDQDFYAVIRKVNIHATTYSTCALEAPAFGIPNVLIDFNCTATKYFKEVLGDETFNRYVTSPESFIKEVCQLVEISDQSEIEKKSDYMISRDYLANLKHNALSIF